ncbi:Hemolysin-type calcium-binding protein [Sulfitobacter noctilucae]|uniref:DUF4214 domain-containing protein n=1 Tax=Sulfitobacter noctilucae TaxID=1342302 RepID=UPI00046AAA16|nr:DUF4214 domain-containing protein [Sulfitobacter noctilucae]KIN70134.1 Hemolysin-type calcium-binding protein [Sulfitobacter noctilucae]
MAVMTLSGLRKTGETVDADMFGANAVFELTDDGTPSSAYTAAAQALGALNIRFGGGQADLDPDKANSAGERPIDGETAINIVDMPDGALRPELINFLTWCQTNSAGGTPTKATLIIPTKHLDVAEYAAFAAEIETFVTTVMDQYGDVIAAFQMGNEYWEMGETAYGIKASLGVEAVERGMLGAGYGSADQPDILVQMGTAGNQGSEFPAVPGVSDFAARNTAANTQIIDQLSDRAIEAIDGVTEHYYYNKSSYELGGLDTEVKNIDKDFAIWADRLGDDLDLHITEWNIKTTASAQHGMVAGSSMVKQFENMIALGVDGAHVWALDYHSRTALTLDTDAGVRLDAQGRVTNSAQGAVFDLMSAALVGKELVTASFANALPDIAVSTYASAQEMVFYVSSRSLEKQDFRLDLSDKLPAGAWISGVQVTMDAATSNGLQWEQGVDAYSVTIDGAPYFYNEHDVDVTLVDLSFDDAAQINLSLKPFEVVELTVSLNGTNPPAPQTPTEAPGTIAGTSGDDILQGDAAFNLIDGDAGFDTAIFSGTQDSYTLQVSATGMALMDRRPDRDGTDTLIDIENLAFADADFAIDHFEGAQNLSAAQFAQITELYIAYFDRAPASKGLLYWAARLEDGMSLDQIAQSFFVQPETQTTYAAYLNTDGSLTDPQAFVTAVFNNVLGRDPSGPYWVDALARADSGVTPANFILSVLNGAKADTGGAADAAYLQAKTDIGVYFSAIKGLSEYDDTRAVMDIFDGSPASVSNAVATIDQLHADALAPEDGAFLIELVGLVDDPFTML